ncbi:glycosyl transferase group 1 [Candidatus Moduliflexus flocculans]|uniref:Glycosyl transferase group 1 n=1 Tax=Candidatus Moduliflexus flocculans TaxID=1499966 RepID=A0A081BLZ8_9BACT|nr:glycosyl transferase group 1 [Candidatus Moduliflexus flocculans]
MALKKTLFLSELYPPLIGGTCSMFSGRFGLYPKDRIVVLTKAVEGAEAFDQTAGYPIHRIPLVANGPKGFEWAGITWSLIKSGMALARQYRIERIECARFLPEGVAGYALAKLLRKKLIVNYHAEEVCVLKNYKVERFLLRRIIRAASLNLPVSSFIASQIREVAGRDIRVEIVPPGFNSSAIAPSDKEAVQRIRSQIGGQPILLTVARLQKRKGQDNVIRALPEILQTFPNARYIILGSDQGGTANYRQELEILAQQLGVNHQVIFVADAKQNELSNYYAASDLFLMPNRFEPPGDIEGFGIVFLEAGFFKKPVIGGNSGGVVDAVRDGNTGFLVNGIDPHDIAQKSIGILSNPGLAANMGENGFTFAQSLSHERVFERYQRALEGL